MHFSQERFEPNRYKWIEYKVVERCGVQGDARIYNAVGVTSFERLVICLKTIRILSGKMWLI